MGSIKADYAKATLAARDEYTDAQIVLADMPKKTLEYREQCERVDSLRDAFISRVVSFIYDESRREQPRMWSALYLALLDMRKLSPQDWISYYSNTIIRALLRALEWDRKPIGDDKLFTCDDFYKYVNLHSRLYAKARFTPGLPKIVGILNGRGVAAAQNADTITRHVASAATTKCDDARIWEYLQLFENFDAGEADIEEHILSAPGQGQSRPALLARVRLRAQVGIGTGLCPAIETADTNTLMEAAQRWRNAIATHIEDGNTLFESDARTAHALLCCELATRDRITGADLAELIETMSEQHTLGYLSVTNENAPYGHESAYGPMGVIDVFSPHMTINE